MNNLIKAADYCHVIATNSAGGTVLILSPDTIQ